MQTQRSSVAHSAKTTFETKPWDARALPCQLPEFANVLLRNAHPSGRRVRIQDVGEFVFSVVSGRGVSLIEGGALRAECVEIKDANNANLLGVLAAQLGVRTIHFPLVYEGTIGFEWLRRQDGVAALRRRPTCAIRFPLPEGTLLGRASARIGSRAMRRVRHFENAEGRVVLLRGNEAAEVMREIELRSWKRSCGQDMLTRGQYSLFSELLQHGAVVMRAARVRGQFIAYRLDCRINRILHILKWSHDEAYRNLSPGFFLLTKDLYSFCAENDIELVDLYGSPDALKAAVLDHYIERYDFIWPNSPESAEVLSERARHDASNEEVHRRGVGIRACYERALLALSSDRLTL